MNTEDRKQQDRVAFILSEYKQLRYILENKMDYYARKLDSRQERQRSLVGECNGVRYFKPRKLTSKYGVDFFYSIIWHLETGDTLGQVYVELDDGFLEIKNDGTESVLYTKHFMQRFLERLNLQSYLEDFSIEKFIVAFVGIVSLDKPIVFEKNLGDFSITHKDWYDACACTSEGMFCIRYVNEKYCVYKTFISKNEFKPSQMRKWEKLMSESAQDRYHEGMSTSYNQVFETRKTL